MPSSDKAVDANGDRVSDYSAFGHELLYMEVTA